MSRQCRENRFLWNGLRHLADSWNGGTTLEFLSPSLWRAPPLEMRRERREFFPEQAAKGSLISSYQVETGLHWMWAGPSCFLYSGHGDVGELLELQQGCEGPFGSSRVSVSLVSRSLSGNGPHLAWRAKPPGFSRVVAGALDIRRGHQRTALVASGLASPQSSYSRALRIPFPSMPGPKTLCGVEPGT